MELDDKNARELDSEAVRILKVNDRGGYTVPTAGLYPYQWNWDSALVALGLATFDIDRAWVELETLFADQWPDGMVPHIVFRQVDSLYYPGPEVWGSDRTPPTSGITQPPVAASVVHRLHIANPQASAERARKLAPMLDRWHQWFADARDPEGTGLVAIIHPWESGRDNLPDWDRPLSFVDVSGVGNYERRDILQVDASQRPGKLDYDRYVALMQFGREVGWDSRKIWQGSPFWVADVGVNAILLRAEKDLAELADTLNLPAIAEAARLRAANLQRGFEQLWSDEAGGYVSLDLRRSEQAAAVSSGCWLALYAGAVPPERVGLLTGLMETWLENVRFGIPSFDPAHAEFDDIRYWRGPVWAIINFMIADGLRRCGRHDLAERVRGDTAALVAKTGFHEYFSPVSAAGGGGSDFSWTAAMWLAWASPNAEPAAA